MWLRPSCSQVSRPLLLGIAIVLPLLAVAVQAESAQPTVTPPEGPSWLETMGVSFERSSLGRLGTLGAEGHGRPSPAPTLEQALTAGFDIDGEDLYRYNCRSCHGAAGAGLPPEVLPLTPAIKATSEAIQHRLTEDDVEAQEAAERAEAAVRHRLEEGGAAMPDFSHFSPEEVDLLLAYLERLVGLAEASREDVTIPRSLLRVGEHVVKGTCQTCHGATESVGRTAVLDPLSELPARYGLVAVMGMSSHAVPGGQARPRGPALGYFRESELAAAYIYLAAYPAK